MTVGPKEAQVQALRRRRAELARDPVKFVEFATDRKLQPFQKRIVKALTEAIASKPITAPVQASAPKQEKTMKKPKAAKAAKKSKGGARRGKSANTSIPRAKKADERARAETKTAPANKPASPKAGTPATEVGDFICRDGGASMAELVKKFEIDAHPMRAKIHYARHTLGYSIETKDGRYYGTAPKAAA